jgi:predicted nucleotidyltransferase
MVSAVDVGQPHAAVSPSLEGEVLVTLSRTTRPLTGSEVAALVRRGTRPGVQKALHRLVAQGLVDAQEAGRRAVLYTLNRDHVAYPAVEILAGLRSELFDRLRERIADWEIPATYASLFGSAARGDGDAGSDVDLFVVRPVAVEEDDPVWRSQLDQLARAVRRWTGNHLAVSEVAEREVARLEHDSPAIVGELERDAVVLVGPATAELLGGRR